MKSTFIHQVGVELARCLLGWFVRKRDEKSKLFVHVLRPEPTVDHCGGPCGSLAIDG